MSEINQVIRILEGKRLKYTITILTKDGKRYEIQSPVVAKPEWNSEDRCLWLACQLPDYSHVFVMPYDQVALAWSEQNEGVTQEDTK